MAAPPRKKAKGAGDKGLVTRGVGERVGSIRYENKAQAMKALNTLNRKPLMGCPLDIRQDEYILSKLIVQNLPEDLEWQELKDHFAQCGTVAFANMKGGIRKGPRLSGEIRFDDPQVSLQAMHMLNGSVMDGGSAISITLDPSWKDNSKLIVTDIPPGTSCQELKDHFAQVSTQVAFAKINKAGDPPSKARPIRPPLHPPPPNLLPPWRRVDSMSDSD